jgi:small subunit ribosomal protein S8
MNDPIADLLTRVRNGCMAEKSRFDIPASKFKKGVLDVLLQEGFIRRYKLIKDNKQDILRVYLKYYNNKSVIQGIQRVSRPGLRRYVSSDDIPVVRNGLGVGVISTSTKGVITSNEAKKHRVGGEYICKVW